MRLRELATCAILLGLSNTIGGGIVQPTGGGANLGLAYDLSQGLIAPISLSSTSVALE